MDVEAKGTHEVSFSTPPCFLETRSVTKLEVTIHLDWLINSAGRDWLSPQGYRCVQHCLAPGPDWLCPQGYRYVQPCLAPRPDYLCP